MSRNPSSAVLTALSVVLLVAACGSSGPSAGSGGSGGSGGSAGGGSNGSPSAVAYSACMRSHGILHFPDPGSGGQVPKADPAQLGVSSAQYLTAQQACAHLIPTTGDTAEQQQELQCAMAYSCSPAVVAKWMSGLRTLAQCLRSNGEPNWPDPVTTAQGIPHFDYTRAGIDHHSSQVLTQVDHCMQVTGFAGLPLP
jgi:hypothetical protein